MKHRFRSSFGFLLAVVLAVTGLSVAHARGQASPAGSMVICQGLTVVTVLVDGEGQPVDQPHVCPDAALALFLQAGIEQPFSALIRAFHPIGWQTPAAVQVVRVTGRARARGPPQAL